MRMLEQLHRMIVSSAVDWAHVRRQLREGWCPHTSTLQQQSAKFGLENKGYTDGIDESSDGRPTESYTACEHFSLSEMMIHDGESRHEDEAHPYAHPQSL